MKQHRFDYNWTLKDAVFTKDKGEVTFSSKPRKIQKHESRDL